MDYRTENGHLVLLSSSAIGVWLDSLLIYILSLLHILSFFPSVML